VLNVRISSGTPKKVLDKQFAWFPFLARLECPTKSSTLIGNTLNIPYSRSVPCMHTKALALSWQECWEFCKILFPFKKEQIGHEVTLSSIIVDLDEEGSSVKAGKQY